MATTQAVSPAMASACRSVDTITQDDVVRALLAQRELNFPTGISGLGSARNIEKNTTRFARNYVTCPLVERQRHG